MTGETEVRLGGEFRVAGRLLTGTAMAYGTESPEHREMFEPGAFSPVPAVPLLLQHDRALVVMPAHGLALADSPEALEIRATLPEKSGVAALVARGSLGGLSVGFQSLQETCVDGVRVIERARLLEVSVVDEPSYPASTADIRARGARGGRLGTLRGRVPTNKRVACRCGPGDCLEALFEEESFHGLMADDAREVLAVASDYQGALASRTRKSVRFWTGKDGSLEFAVDIPNTARGTALMETMEAVPVYGRPVLDMDASDLTVANRVATYRDARVRAITMGATDSNEGWDELVLGTLGEGPPKAIREAVEPRRRSMAWL